jgi:hypothetical protein
MYGPLGHEVAEATLKAINDICAFQYVMEDPRSKLTWGIARLAYRNLLRDNLEED